MKQIEIYDNTLLKERVVTIERWFNVIESTKYQTKGEFKPMEEINPQPLPPRIELGEAIEVITAATLRAIEARRVAEPMPNPWLAKSNIRIIAGGIIDVQGGDPPTVID